MGLAAGGAFMAAANFSLSQVLLAGNAAYLGGGIFVDADVAEGVSLAGLAFVSNSAVLGAPLPVQQLSTGHPSAAAQGQLQRGRP